jgi:hypothetical protein
LLRGAGADTFTFTADDTFTVNSAGSHLNERLNITGLTGMNRRGNEGWSRYHGLNLELATRRHQASGIQARGTYTWSHNIDNASSFFADTDFEAFQPSGGGFGFSDPWNPSKDKGDAFNDIRHRTTMSWDWAIPFARDMSGAASKVLHGWSFTGIFIAQTGAPFTVYDDSFNRCSVSDFTNMCFPFLAGPYPTGTETPHPTDANTFNLYDFGSTGTFLTQEDFCSSPNFTGFNFTQGATQGLNCTSVVNNLLGAFFAPRNQGFRTPGFWTMSLGFIKDTAIGERYHAQFKFEMFNVFNHANLFVNPGTLGVTQEVATGSKAGRRVMQLTLKFIW